jgi:hypothetical protein
VQDQAEYRCGETLGRPPRHDLLGFRVVDAQPLSREVEIHFHGRVVAARLFALLVKVLDVPHDPVAADPDEIIAPWRARRVLPPPSFVGDGT